MTNSREGGPESHGRKPPSIHYNKSGLRAAFAVHKRSTAWRKTLHNFNSISTSSVSSFHIWHALPDMFQFIDHPDVPRTSNGLESFFGHIKDHMRIHRGLSLEHHKNFVKWYLNFNAEKGKKKR